MDNHELLAGYKESLKVAWGYNDYEDWPLRISSIMHLFTDTFAQEFLDDVEALWTDELGPELMSRIFVYPGRLFRLIDVVIFGLRRIRTPLDLQRRFITQMLRSAETLKSGDLFNRDGCNLLKQAIIPPQEMFSSGHSNLIHKLQAALFMYTEAILFRGHDAVKSVHGPYKTDKGTMMLIREFHNLSPDQLWPEHYLIPTKKVVTICEYAVSADIRVDCYDHLYHSGKLNESLISWNVTVDDEVVTDPERIISLVDDVISRTRTVSNLVDSWSWQQKTEKYADIFWFRKAPLRLRRGLPAEPPQSVYDRIRQGQPNELRSKCLSPREVAFLIQLGV